MSSKLALMIIYYLEIDSTRHNSGSNSKMLLILRHTEDKPNKEIVSVKYGKKVKNRKIQM